MTARGRRSLAPRISLFYFLDIITAMSGIMILIALYFSTCLREGSPLFPGSVRWQSRDAEGTLQAALLRLNSVKNRETELKEKLRWANLTPAEVRRKLRRLQWSGSERGTASEAEPRPLDQVLQEVGLASLRDQIRQGEAGLAQRQVALEEIRRAHDGMDRRVRLAQESAAGRLAEKKGLRLVADGRDTNKVPVMVEISDARVVTYPLDQPSAREVFEPGSEALRRLRRIFSLYTPESHYAFLLVQPSGYGLFAEFREQLGRLGFEVGYEGVPEDPRYLMPDVTPGKPVGRHEAPSIGEPEPWPVEGPKVP